MGLKNKVRITTSTRQGEAIHTNVRRRTSVFQVSHALRSNVSWNTNASATIRNPRAEARDMASLVPSSQPQIVVFSIHQDVIRMFLGQFLDCLLDLL